MLAGTVVVTIRNWTKRKLTRPPEEQVILAIEQPVSTRTLARALPLGFDTRVSRPKRNRWQLEDGRFLVRDYEWKPKYGWHSIQRPEDMDFLQENRGSMIRFRLLREGEVRFYLEMTPNQWSEAVGNYSKTSRWPRHGYIVAITRRQKGEYTEEFQKRWRDYVRPAP